MKTYASHLLDGAVLHNRTTTAVNVTGTIFTFDLNMKIHEDLCTARWVPRSLQFSVVGLRHQNTIIPSSIKIFSNQITANHATQII